MPDRLGAVATAPRLNRCQLLASFLLGWAFGGVRKHRILDPPAGGSGDKAVVVKVTPRSARLLLLCGCASAPQDEIVE